MGVAELTGYLDTASDAALALGGSLTPHSYNNLLATALLSGGLQGGGLATLALTSGSVTPSSTDLANGTLVLSGALTGNVTITMPSSGMWAIIMSCTGAYTVTFQCGTGSVKYAIPALKSADETAHQTYYITSIVCNTNSVFGDSSWRIDGSNSNGSYIKFGDGTLECFGAVAPASNNNAGTQYTYPAEFYSLKSLIAQANSISSGGDGSSYVTESSAGSVTVFKVKVLSHSATAISYVTNVSISWKAIGRWKA